jgi:hypothetical protein
VRLTIDEAEQLAPGIWRASINPSDMAMFGSAPSRAGLRTVVLLTDVPQFSPARRQLAFDPRAVRPLNLGTGPEVLMVSAIGEKQASPTRQVDARGEGGDGEFLKALPRELLSVGRALIDSVRQQFRGELIFVENSGRYVESPDNFWTVKIQPRDKSLRITVRGRPQQLPVSHALSVADDRPGYSTFKVSTLTAVPDAVRIIVGAGSRAR